ncbi:hypothetical protein HQ865_22435 [Mucilaginibacter mali]|uniref:Outer membrane protein beta-barrel domain-containing protein n=1 Tax=Mucilaginibacter mali TaxID=2740462 RepID=A0A7D4UNX2_9SPHI|nr:hypothetical protein [Mucilaginibacter mali]QKJ32401.1 hypothetical protein HQ865_22435 [Mucilaginibacter mali]
MRKLLLAFVIVTAALNAKAQTEKGTLYLGGSVSYFNQKSNTSGSYFYQNQQLNVKPTIGMFVGSKWAIGITPMYSYYKDSSFTQGPGYTSSTLSKSKMLGGGIDVRYYITLGQQFAFFPQFNGSYLTSAGHSNSPNTDHVFSAAISPNFAFFATKKIAVNMAYGALLYQQGRSFSQVSGPATKTEMFGISASGGVSLGVSYHFTK